MFKNQASPESNLIVRQAFLTILDICFPTLPEPQTVGQPAQVVSAAQTSDVVSKSLTEGKTEERKQVSIIPQSLASKIKEKFIIVLKPDIKDDTVISLAVKPGPITSFKCAAYKLAHSLRTKLAIHTGHIFSFAHKAFAAEVTHDQLADIVNHPDVLRIEHDYILTAQGFRATGDDLDVKLTHSKIAPRIIGATSAGLSSSSILSRLRAGVGTTAENKISAESTSAYDSHQTVPWGISEIGAPNSSQKNHQGKSVTISGVEVFVIDTGGSNHPDLNVVDMKNFVSTENWTTDRNGHSNHVLGTIGAKDNTSGVVGGAPGVALHTIKVLGADGSGQMSWVMAGIDYVVQYKKKNPTKAVVANLSLGFYTGTTAKNAIDEAVINAVNAGVVMVLAAGNDGREAALASPAHASLYCSCITVGSYGQSKNLSSFSNRGSAVTILAPGEAILSTWLGAGYSKLSGTSMASPHVASLAALYLSKYPAATPDQVKQALIATARNGYVKSPKGTTTLAAYNRFYD